MPCKRWQFSDEIPCGSKKEQAADKSVGRMQKDYISYDQHPMTRVWPIPVSTREAQCSHMHAFICNEMLLVSKSPKDPGTCKCRFHWPQLKDKHFLTNLTLHLIRLSVHFWACSFLKLIKHRCWIYSVFHSYWRKEYSLEAECKWRMWQPCLCLAHSRERGTVVRTTV